MTEMRNMNKLLGTVDKNSRERIEVRATEYEGRPYIDIRSWWRSNDDDGWKPSKKGVTLRSELVKELIALLKKAENKGKA